MNFDLANWALGFVTAVVVAVVGRLAYKFITERLEKHADLEWYVLATFSAPDLELHKKSFELFSAAKKAAPEKFTDEVVDGFRSDFSRSKNAVRLKIRNKGRGASQPISILLNKEPTSLVVDPTAAISKRVTADGKTELELPTVNKCSAAVLMLYGVSSYDVSAVFHNGIEISKRSWIDLVPSKKERNVFLWVLWAFIAGAWAQDGIDYLVEKNMENGGANLEQDAPPAIESETSE